MRKVSVLCLGSSLALLAGCSISESISKSVSSPFEWSSASIGSSSRSSSPNRAEDYRTDVRDYTSAYVKSGGDFDAFTRGLSGIASQHGVSNWESDTDTYIGIGQGLRKAGVTPTQLEVWKSNLAKGNASTAAAIQKGYDSTSQ
jgi:hypothetical protein